jgi:hypothetical protein
MCGNTKAGCNTQTGSYEQHNGSRIIVKGYVTDAETNAPIEEIRIEVSRSDKYYDYDYYHEFDELYCFDWNYDVTDATGYYELSLRTGGNYTLIAYNNISIFYGIECWDDDFSTFVLYQPYTTEFTVAPNETLWLNITLEPLPPKTARVCGYVTDAITGVPVPGIEVNVFPNSMYFEAYKCMETMYFYHYIEGGVDLTNDTGYYDIALYPGNYSLFITAYGFAQPSYMVEDIHYEICYYPYETVFTIAENETLILNISIEPIRLNAKLCGYVTDTKTGEAIVGASVNIWCIDLPTEIYGITISPVPMEEEYEEETTHYIDGIYYDEYSYNTESYFEPLAGVGYAYTQAEGYFEIDIVAGNYELYVTKELEYYPYRTEISIADEQTLWVNLSLEPLAPINSCVWGIVTDSVIGKPIPGAHIALTSNDRFSYFTDYTNGDGTYEIDVRAGHYTMVVSVFYYPEYHTVDSYDDNFFIEEDEEAAVTADNPNYDADEPVDGSIAWKKSFEPFVGPAKRYFEYRTSFTIGDNEELELNVELDPYPMETSTIKGYITDAETGDTISDAWVFATIYVNGHKYHNWTCSSTTGYYALNVPAAYIILEVTALPYYETKPIYELEEVTSSFSEVFTTYLSAILDLEVGEYEVLELNISLERLPPVNSMVKGKVVDPEGNPIPYAWVRLIDLDHYSSIISSLWSTSWTSGNGNFTLRTYSGNFMLVIEPMDFFYPEGYQPYFASISIAEGETLELGEITLEPATIDNKLELTITFGKGWDKADVSSKLTINRGSFFIRWLVDVEYGNRDGELSDTEKERFIAELTTYENIGLVIELTVDTVVYYPVSSSYKIDIDNLVGPVISEAPIIFNISLELSASRGLSSTEAHTIKLNVRFYMAGTLTYNISLPEDYMAPPDNQNYISGEAELIIEHEAIIGHYAGYKCFGQPARMVSGDLLGMIYAETFPQGAKLLKGNELCVSDTIIANVEYTGAPEKKAVRKVFIPSFQTPLTIISILVSAGLICAATTIYRARQSL